VIDTMAIDTADVPKLSRANEKNVRDGYLAVRSELQLVLLAAKEIPVDELPRLLGQIEEIRVTALARLTGPASASQPDELLDVHEAAHRLRLSKDYLYRHHARLPFTRRIGKRLLFSRTGIEKYIRTA
jgi:excisionase family DNA binding protein